MEKIYFNSTFNKFAPKNIFTNYLFFILGTISSFPIFINLNDLNLLFIKFNPDNITVKVDGLPIPIGAFSFILYLFLVMLRTRSIVSLMKTLTGYVLFLLPFLYGFDLLRIPILLFPILFLIILKTIIVKRYQPNDGFALGYIFGLILIYSINIISFLYLSLVELDFLNLEYARQIFGFEIWQYYVVFSAITSLVFGSYTLYFLNNFKYLNKFRIVFFTLSILSLVCLILPYRKAAFIDLTIIIIILVFQMINYFKKLRVKKIYLISFILSIIAFIFFRNTLDSKELFDLNDRLAIASIVIDNLSSLNLYTILFGFEKGFGGYSNLFVEFFIRNGLVGFFTYFGILIFSFFRFVKAIINIPELPKTKNLNVIFFILASSFVGNFVNLNFGVPYFSINFACILTSFYSIDMIARNRMLKNN